MSLRQRADRARIERFIRELAGKVRRPARLYLTGGTSLVFEGLRAQTLDIDLAIEVAAEDHAALIRAIRELKESLSLNVEEASPADFIPLPAGFESRHQFIGRFGSLDVLHFDLYSTALSKIERGRVQDLEDVLALLGAGRLEWAKLQGYFAEILPRMGEHSLRQDPVEFEQNFQALAALRGGGRGSEGGGL